MPGQQTGVLRCSRHELCLNRLSLRASSFLFLCLVLAFSAAPAGTEPAPASLARQAYTQTKAQYQQDRQNPETAWLFARACFDLGNVATNKTERAAVAEEGIAACEQALTRAPNSAPLHYYLGLNVGQLARTRTLGALKLVDQIEREFTRAIELDPKLDYAGAERSLGMLYRDSPAIVSIGSRPKARQHLARAVELAPEYPDNRLTLIEACLQWEEREPARRELKALEASWPAARTHFVGPAWAASWTDWEGRLEKARKKLEEPAKLETPRH
jgi:hypothetical protein